MSDTPEQEAHWQDTDRAIQRKLSLMRIGGVKTITWRAHKGACDPCAGNDGQTVKRGERFKSGARLPPEHNHCGCNWADNQGQVYEWTGTDGEYKPVENT